MTFQQIDHTQTDRDVRLVDGWNILEQAVL